MNETVNASWRDHQHAFFQVAACLPAAQAYGMQLRIASDPNASILITGYQDEESPGKRLLDLAEKKENTLMLGGTAGRGAMPGSKI